jgi:hypothetical protein
MPKVKIISSQTNPSGSINLAKARGSDLFPAEGLSNLASGVGQLGDVMGTRATQNEVSGLGADLAKLRGDQVNKWRDTLANADPNDDSLVDKFMAEYDAEYEKLQDKASTGTGSRFLQQSGSVLRQNLLTNAVQGKTQLAITKIKTEWETSLNSYGAALRTNPADLQSTLTQLYLQIDHLADTTDLTRKEALLLRQEGEKHLFKMSYLGHIDINPGRALKALESGRDDAQLGGDLKGWLLNKAKKKLRDNDLQSRLNAKKEADALKQEQRKIQDTFLEKFVKGDLSIKEVVDSKLEPFGSGSQNQFRIMLSSGASKGSSSSFRMLLKRINLDHDDPSRLWESKEIVDALAGGKINTTEANELYRYLEGTKTPEGIAVHKLKKLTMDSAEQLIAKNRWGIPNSFGTDEFKQFVIWFNAEFDRLTREGKSPIQLLDKNSPDYLGKQILRFVKPLKEQMRDEAALLKHKPKVELPTREKGESAHDFLQKLPPELLNQFGADESTGD